MPFPLSAFRQAPSRLGVCLVVMAAVLLSGCDGLTYAPSGENRVEVDPAPKPEVAVPLADTMDVWDASKIKYEADLKQDAFVDAYLVIDGEQYGESKSFGTVALETRRLRDGTHPFDLVIETRRGGPTLAGQVGATTTTTIFSGVLRVVNNVDPTLDGVDAAIREGALRISWTTTPAPPPGFDSYIVERRDVCCTNGWQGVARIEDARKRFVDDLEYTGGRVEYRVRMRARGRFDQRRIEGTYAPLMTASLQVNGPEATVTWEPTPLTRSFRSYVVQRLFVLDEESSFTAPTWLTIATIEDVNQTSFRETLDVFGGEFKYRVVNTSPVIDDVRYIASDPTTSFRPPRDTVSWGGLDVWDRYLPAQDGFIKSDPGGVTQIFDRTTKNLRLEKTLPEDVTTSRSTYNSTSLSPDGSRLYRTTADFRVQEYDVATLTQVNTYDLTSFIPEVYQTGGAPGLLGSDEGRLFVALGAYRSPTFFVNRGLAIFDVSGDQPVLNDLFDLYVDSYLIGRYSVVARDAWGSGKHALIKLESESVDHLSLYRIEPDTAVATFEISPPEHTYTRNGVDYYTQFDQRGFDEPGVLSAYRVSDGEKVKEIEIEPGISSLQLDPGTGYFGSVVRKVSGDVTSNPTELYGPSSYLIYSLDDGLVRDVPVAYGATYTLSGGVLWNENAYLDLFDPTQ